MIQLSLTVHADGNLRLKQIKFSHVAQRLIAAMPTKEWDPVDESWSFPTKEAQDVWARVAGAGDLRMDDAVKAILSDHRRSAAATVPTPEITDYQFKTTPFAHQRQAFHLARKVVEYAFLMEMGTGKTKAIIDVMSYHKQRNRLDAFLVVVPKAVLYNWEIEVGIHSPLPAGDRRTLVLTGSKKREALAAGGMTANFIITNYETVLSMGAELRELFVRRRMGIVLDEATRIKNPSSKTFKGVKQLGLIAKCRYLLTGTPVTQSPLDAYALFNFLNPNILGHLTFTSFKAEYALHKKLASIPVPIVVGYRNLNRLSKLILPHSLRVLKSECLDLPDKIYRKVELDMGPKQRELYERMETESVIEPKPGIVVAAPIVLTRILRLQQICSGFWPEMNEFGKELAQHSIEDAPKLEACDELVQEAVDSGQKVIVWCRFLWEMRELTAILRKAGHKVVTYFGETTAVDRQKAVESIQTGDAQVFLGQISTGGMGITLTKCSTVIYYSNTFSLAERLQSEDRAHRIGQTNKVTYIDLVCRRSVDKVVLAALKDKKNLADIVTGDNLKKLMEASND